MAHRSIPGIDLSLLDTNRDTLALQLKHALVEFGAFYITSFEDHFDENIIALFNDQAKQFFKWEMKKKLELGMMGSDSFLGYTNESVGLANTLVSETVNFCSSTNAPAGIKVPYTNVAGQNRYPTKEDLPYSQKATEDLLPSFASFSDLLTELIIDALELKNEEASRSLTLRDPTRRYSKMSTILQHPLCASTYPTQTQEYSTQKNTSLLTYMFQPSSQHTSMQVQDIFGEWLEVPPTKSIVVTVGQSLEHITQGVCISGSYRFLPPKSTRIITPFHQHVALDSRLALLTIKPKFLEVKKNRDSLRSSSMKSTFNPVTPVARMLFLDLVKKHRDVAKIRYPDILETIEEEERKAAQRAARGSKNNLDFSLIQHRLVKVFSALDSIIYMNVRSKISDIKLHQLLPQVKRFSEFNVKYEDLLQVLYIWPDCVSLKANNEDGFIIDVEETKSVLDIKHVGTRTSMFAEKLRAWIHKNKGVDVPILTTDSVTRKEASNVALRKRARAEIIQKDTTKKKVRKNEDGLSLLERIQKKQQERLDTQLPPQQRRLLYLDGKLPQILDIVATMRPDKAHSIDALTEQVVNSLKSKLALDKDEAKDLVLHLGRKFPEVFKLFEGRSISVLKWKDFNVNELKQRLM